MTVFRSISRREFALPALAARVASATAARAQTGLGQAEWRQNYDSVTNLKVHRSLSPVLSPLTLQATEQMIETYRRMAATGGWPQMPNVALRLGQKGPGVIALRRRLIASGDIDAAAGGSQTFDSYVEAGVKRFQERHGLIPTGIVAASTVTAMNVPAETRLRQLEINIVRLRTYAGNLGPRFVVANIPAALIETVENGLQFGCEPQVLLG